MIDKTNPHDDPEGPRHSHSAGVDSGPPPVLHSWPRLYALVIGELALLIVLFYEFSRLFQ